jgi:hypothetical protein
VNCNQLLCIELLSVINFHLEYRTCESITVFYVICEHFIRQIKHRIIRWVRHVARMGKERNIYEVLLENLKERDHS